MEKTYLKNGNSTTRGNHYCMKHFIEVHKRAPNISDKATFRCCVRRIANNKAIIQAMTDDELFTTRDMINKELKFRQTDFLTIPNYNGGIR